MAAIEPMREAEKKHKATKKAVQSVIAKNAALIKPQPKPTNIYKAAPTKLPQTQQSLLDTY